MRLILFDPPADKRANFKPLSLGCPIWQLRCGMTTLGEKLIARLAPAETGCFVEPYMAAAWAERVDMPVNDASSLDADDVLMVNSRVKASGFDVVARGPGEVGVADDGEVLYVRLPAGQVSKLQTGSLDELLSSAKRALPVRPCRLATWGYIWDLILANAQEITREFAARGQHGLEGTVEQAAAIRGDNRSVYVAPGAKVHPMAVIDTEHGPVYLDRDVEVQPFTRIEGPCYVGPGTTLLGGSCREGNSIGPVCRIGGEVEQSIIQGYSNKYHDGFLGHAYVGEWVNLGALTTNSDLKNDYSTVSVILDGKKAIDTGSTKVGSLIGDHAKTSIGTLLNTGSYVGAMAVIMAAGKPLQKFIPSFAWLIDGIVTRGFGRQRLYEAAATVMGRRGQAWSDAQQAMWDAVFEMTAGVRDPAIKRGRKAMMRK